MRVVAFGRSGRGCTDPPFRASMVIFVPADPRPVTIFQRVGALTNRTQRAILRTRRQKRSGFEAWIAGEEGSIGVRLLAHGLRQA